MQIVAEASEMAWYIPFAIFIARIGDVSISTVRTIILINGHKYAAAVMGFFEVLIWVMAVGGALHYLNEPTALIGYAGGYATGILVGMTIEQRIAVGYRMVRVISRDRTSVGKALREKGYTVTELDGRAMEGPVEIVFLAAKRRRLPEIRRTIHEADPEAFMTVEACEKPGAAGSLTNRRSIFASRSWLGGGFVRR